jgi:hypothetical protein
MSALLQAIAPNPHTNLLNVYIQIANKMGFQKKNSVELNTEHRLCSQSRTTQHFIEHEG